MANDNILHEDNPAEKSDFTETFTATGLLLLFASSIMKFIEISEQSEAFSSYRKRCGGALSRSRRLDTVMSHL